MSESQYVRAANAARDPAVWWLRVLAIGVGAVCVLLFLILGVGASLLGVVVYHRDILTSSSSMLATLNHLSQRIDLDYGAMRRPFVPEEITGRMRPLAAPPEDVISTLRTLIMYAGPTMLDIQTSAKRALEILEIGKDDADRVQAALQIVFGRGAGDVVAGQAAARPHIQIAPPVE